MYAAATPGHADLQVVLRYPDGSTAAITYATSGSTQFQKETIDLTADGKVLRFDDFARASVYARKKWASSRLPKAPRQGPGAPSWPRSSTPSPTGGPMPVPVDSLAATTLRHARGGRPA